MTDLDAVRLRLRDKFVATARERRARMTAGAGAARAELHALAGEASMMGETALATRARSAEKLALAWEQGDAAAEASLATELVEIAAMIDSL